MYDFTSMTPMEYRTLHRYTLHPLDQRGCTKCNTLFKGIKENFHIKRHSKTGITAYNTLCRTCQSDRSKAFTTKARKNPEHFIRLKLASYRSRAKQEGADFNVTSDYLIELFNKQKGLCYYTGQEISFEHITKAGNAPHRLTPSLDRLDPKKGYTIGNVAWCAYYINRMKNDCNYIEFLELCEQIIKYRSQHDT